MPSPWQPQQADLERKLGGALVLGELVDPSGTGTPDPGFVESCLANGRARVRGAVEVKHDPEALDTLTSDDASWLRRIATVVSAWTAWSDAGRGDAMPRHLQDEFTQAETDLDRIASGLRRVGRASGGKDVALNQPIGVVDPASDLSSNRFGQSTQTRMTVDAMRASGFR